MAITFDGTQPYTLVSYTYECLDNIYTIGDLSLRSDYSLIIVAGLDFVMTISFLIWLCSETSAEEKE